MRRVVVTGIGIVSCLGNGKTAVLDSLKAGRSGIRHNQTYADIGMRSHVSGSIDINVSELIDRKLLRFMGDASAYSYLSMQEAIKDAGLEEEQVSNFRSGIVAGSGGGSPKDQLESTDIAIERGIKRVGPYRVPRTMSSSVSACLATSFKIKGINYSISSACATSAHCIGNAMELIQMDKQDLVFAGGGESEHWSLSHMFDAMGALSTKYNDSPEKASRAFDADRDGDLDGLDIEIDSGVGGQFQVGPRDGAVHRIEMSISDMRATGAVPCWFASLDGSEPCPDLTEERCPAGKPLTESAQGSSSAADLGVQMNNFRRLGVSLTTALSAKGPVMATLATTGSPLRARYGSRRNDGSNKSSIYADVFDRKKT